MSERARCLICLYWYLHQKWRNEEKGDCQRFPKVEQTESSYVCGEFKADPEKLRSEPRSR